MNFDVEFACLRQSSIQLLAHIFKGQLDFIDFDFLGISTILRDVHIRY